MKELQSLSWYAARVKPHLPKEAFKPVPERLWGGLAFLVIAVSGILAIGLLDLNVWVSLFISIILGLCFASLGLLGHEILHGTVVRKPWIRDLTGAIAFFPLCTGPRLWRKWHNMTHHVHTQDEEEDPDSWPTITQFAKSKFLKVVYKLPFGVRAFLNLASLSVMFTFHSWRMFSRFIKDFKPEKRPIVWLQFMLPLVTWAALLVWLGPVKWLFAYFIPFLISNFIVMAYISTNHRLNPLVPVNDPLANSLTVTVPKWVDVIHFNFSHHTEHHLFPAMSSKYYPLVKEQLKRQWPERYHEMSLIKALATLYKTPRIYNNQTELVDPYPGHTYGTLGHGLNPENLEYQMVEQEQKAKEPKKSVSS
ncbi:MAG TPA: fatty acid desaturase [Chondromyces sp.]|nr:fatty acid desaturase [Chondromyces sp.]